MLKPESTFSLPKLFCWSIAIGFVYVAQVAGTLAVDRTTLVIPQKQQAKNPISKRALFPDMAIGEASEAWKAYMSVWKLHRERPGDKTIRGFLGLPLTAAIQVSSKAGRSAPRWMNWRSGSYQQIDSPHFTIYSRADGNETKRIAEDLESCYWVWTQMFFPFWEGSAQVTTLFREYKPGEDLIAYLKRRKARITIRRKLRVVLFRDASEYQQTLGKHIPGIEQSTGFYSDQQQMTFLYAGENDDAATRRHELMHQLFRQASTSTLGRNTPGKDAGFWLVEGIAGYFESLQLHDGLATVGGWDASRLQFARYRMLVAGDMMPMSELTRDGQKSAQQRQDLARWYAHAITKTHQLFDQGDTSHRRWMYQQLASCYKIRSDISGQLSPTNEREVIEFLKVTDQHLSENPALLPLRRLCLAGCEVTAKGLTTIPASPNLDWLDLSRLPIGNEDVIRLAPKPASVSQLTLEQTRVDSGLSPWLAKASRLTELDLSWTPMDDSVIKSLSSQKIQTLWMTGTKLTGESLDKIAKMQELKSVDLQRTQVKQAGVDRLEKSRPNLQVNPLELRQAN